MTRILLNCRMVVLSEDLEIVFSNVIKSKEFQYPSIVFLSIYILAGQVRSGDQDYSCSMLLYHVISTTCSNAGGWGSTALAGHSSRSMLVSTQN